MRGVVELLRDTVARAAGSVDASIIRFGIGISALDHESGDHAVELCAVVKASSSQLLEVLDVLWSLVREELDDDFAVIRLHDGDFVADSRSCHAG